jgi:hypothetical protein
MSRRPAFASACAVVLLLVGQFVALHHEAKVQHVTCEEHGEQLDAPRLTSNVDDARHAHWIGIDGAIGAHHDCAISRLLRTSSRPSESIQTHLITPIVATLACIDPRPQARPTDVLLIAPKTSPPA